MKPLLPYKAYKINLEVMLDVNFVRCFEGQALD